MNIFLPVYSLLLLGTCLFFSSLFFTRRGMRITVFALATSFWVSAMILVGSNEKVLVDLLLSDYGMSDLFANQVMGSLLVFGFGWCIFVFLSTKTTTRPSQMTHHQRLLCVNGEVRIFRPTMPGILVWIPTVVLLTAIWIVLR